MWTFLQRNWKHFSKKYVAPKQTFHVSFMGRMCRRTSCALLVPRTVGVNGPIFVLTISDSLSLCVCVCCKCIRLMFFRYGSQAFLMSELVEVCTGFSTEYDFARVSAARYSSRCLYVAWTARCAGQEVCGDRRLGPGQTSRPAQLGKDSQQYTVAETQRGKLRFVAERGDNSLKKAPCVVRLLDRYDCEPPCAASNCGCLECSCDCNIEINIGNHILVA